MKKTFKSVLALLFIVLMLAGTMTMASAISTPTLKVKSVTATSVTLYWTKVADADDYQIQRSTDAKNWTTIATGVTGTQYTDSKSLVTGKAYAYRIRARENRIIGSDNYSAYTAAKGCIAKPIPAKVTGLKVKAANATKIQLTWNKVAGVSGYTVQYLSGSTWKTYKNLTANSIIVSNLKLGATYTFRVAAVKIVSGKWIYGTPSDSLKASPVLPATSKVVLSGVNASAFKLTWAGVSGAKGYEVFNHNTGKWINAGTAKSLIIKGFKPGETGEFSVRAYAGSVKGLESKVYSFKTAPAVPTNITIKDATDSTLTYTWDPVDGADGYQVAYYTRANAKWLTLPLTTSTTITVSGLGARVECGFRVRAYTKNSNVHNISAYATSAYSPNKVGKTALAAPTLVANKSTSETDISIKWSSVKDAVGYSVEKYNVSYRRWDVYDFTNNTWKSYGALEDDSVITTTALSFLDHGSKHRGDVYRVRGYDAQGNKGTASAEVTAFTSSIVMNNTAGTFVVQQNILWPKAISATKYKVITRNAVSSVEDVVTFNASSVERDDGTCVASLYLAPNTTHSIMIFALDENGNTSHAATDWVTFKVGAVPVLASNHKYYVASVNSQLLYLAQAINNTKVYNDPITVTNQSSVAYNVNYLKFLAFEYDTPEKVAKFFERFGGDEMATSASESFNATYKFDEGVALTEEGKTVKLRSFVEPSGNSLTSAYLHNSQNYKAWKNGFSSVTAKKGSDGSLTMTLKFKREYTDTPYHNGYMSAFTASDFAGEDSGLSVKELYVGESTLTAVIDKDGILKSYVASSPYSARFVASFTADDDSSDLGVSAGSLISMEMGIAGKTVFNYKFTR